MLICLIFACANSMCITTPTASRHLPLYTGKMDLHNGGSKLLRIKQSKATGGCGANENIYIPKTLIG